jgi:hypothetical protein
MCEYDYLGPDRSIATLSSGPTSPSTVRHGGGLHAAGPGIAVTLVLGWHGKQIGSRGLECVYFPIPDHSTGRSTFSY